MPNRPPPAELLVGVPLAAIAGVAVGVLGTFKHQVGVSATTGAGFPLGLLLSLALVGVVLAAIRVAFPTRLYAVVAAVAVVAVVFVLSNRGPGGSVVVLGNFAGTVWTIAPAILAAVVVGFPRVGRRDAAPAGASGGTSGGASADASSGTPSAARSDADGMMGHPTEGSGPA